MKRSWFGIGEHHSGLFDPKRSGSRGFHEGIFDEGFGGFSTLRKRGKRSDFQKRRPEMTSRGIHGDAFTGRCVLASKIDFYFFVHTFEVLLLYFCKKSKDFNHYTSGIIVQINGKLALICAIIFLKKKHTTIFFYNVLF